MVPSPKILKAAATLELTAKRSVSGSISGQYRSPFRGTGMQFKEFRHYEPGDDIRHMSWSVTARTGKATIKTFEEERELNILLLIDTSGSSLFGIGPQRKVDMYADIVLTTGLAASRLGNKFGVLFFNNVPQWFAPPSRQRMQSTTATRKLLSFPLQGAASDLRPSLHFLQSSLHSRSLILILSDFIFPEFEDEISVLSRRHEIVLMHGYDDAERGFSLNGVYEVWDPEQKKFLAIDGNSKAFRRELSQYQTELRSKLTELRALYGIDYLPLSVQDDYLQRLIHFFHARPAAR